MQKRDSHEKPEQMSKIAGTDFENGITVSVNLPDDEKRFGVIKWMGRPEGPKSDVLIGVELFEKIDKPNSEVILDYKFFNCEKGCGVYVKPEQCLKEDPFVDADVSVSQEYILNECYRNDIPDSPIVTDIIAPREIFCSEQLEEICGPFKGIQGHHNSCYLDATLFSMFAFTYVFDTLLYRPSNANDLDQYSKIQTILRDEIVHPLRKTGFVSAEKVMKLRKFLDKTSGTGYTCEEKDPEEFLNSIFSDIFKIEPLLQVCIFLFGLIFLFLILFLLFS